METDKPNPEIQNLKVARFDGVCCFCKKPTKARESLHFFRLAPPAATGMPYVTRTPCTAHRDCATDSFNIPNAKPPDVHLTRR